MSLREKICVACKKQFRGEADQRFCLVCDAIVPPSPVDLKEVHARKISHDTLIAFVKHTRDRMTEIISNAGNVEYVNTRAAIVRQDAEDLLDE